jgi:lysophospholipase L1-like esterase
MRKRTWGLGILLMIAVAVIFVLGNLLRWLQDDLDSTTAQLQDWPQLAYYQAANAELLETQAPVTAVFIGDSITERWSQVAPQGFFPGRDYVNRGISGQTTPQVLLRFRQDVIQLQPRAVVIGAGTNDLAGNTGPMPLSAIEDNLATLAELATVHSIAVVLASLLPVHGQVPDVEIPPLPQTVRRPPEKIQQLNDWMRTYAEAQGHIYLDYASSLADDQGLLKVAYSADGLHPNAAGYAVMAPLAIAAIEQAASPTDSRSHP